MVSDGSNRARVVTRGGWVGEEGRVEDLMERESHGSTGVLGGTRGYEERGAFLDGEPNPNQTTSSAS